MPGKYEAFTDAELTRRVRQDDPDAFAELSARYLRLIRGKAALFGENAPEKEDLCQEGFLGLYLAAASFSEEGGASFATYAGACVYRRMVTAARRHSSGKNRALNESLSLDSAGLTETPAAESPEALLELREHFEALQRRMDEALSPLERRVLTLYLSGRRRGEIPQLAGASQKACDNALQRARSKLKNV